MNYSALKNAMLIYMNVIEVEDQKYQTSSLKEDLFKVEKTKTIGLNIFANLISKWVYLQNNLHDEENKFVTKWAIQQIKAVIGVGFHVFARVLAKLYIQRKFEILEKVENQIQQMITKSYVLKVNKIWAKNKKNSFSNGNTKKQTSQQESDLGQSSSSQQIEKSIENQTQQHELDNDLEQKSQIMMSLHQQYSDQPQFKSIIDCSSIQMESMNDIEQLNSFVDYSQIVINQNIKCPNLARNQYLTIPDRYQSSSQEQNLDPNNPIVIYLENDIHHACSDLSQFVHQYRINHPVYTRQFQNKKYKVKCTLNIPFAFQTRFTDMIYSGCGIAYNSKTAKTQAVKKLLYQLFSKNPKIWKNFIEKKKIKGIDT